MAQVHAFIRLDPDHAPEQDAFVRSRTTVLREAGGQFWVQLDEAQLDTLVSQGLGVTVAEEAGPLVLGPIALTPGEGAEPQPPAALRAAPPQGEAGGYWWLRWVAPPAKDWLQALGGGDAGEADGSPDAAPVAVHTLDAQTAVWRLTAAQAETARGLPEVLALGLWHPAYVPDLELAGLADPLPAERADQLALALPADDRDAGNVQLRAFDAVDEAGLRTALEGAGASVVSTVAHGFVLRVPPARAAAVFSVPGLLSAHVAIEVTTENFNAGIIVGTNQVRHRGAIDFTVNLDGTGEIVGVLDSGCDTGVLATIAPELQANVRMLRNHANPANNVADNANHGTHVVGTVCGDGTGFVGPPPIVGMASAAAVVMQGPLPGDPRPPFDFAAGQGAGIITNSWGSTPSAVTVNRYLPSHALPLDRWCWLNPDVLLVFSAGNNETDANGDGVLDNVGLTLQKVAKNILTVGACEGLRSDGGWANSYTAFFGAGMSLVPGGNGAAGAFTVSDNAGQVALFSGRGAVRTAAGTATGRIKPDIVAPGTNILSLRSSQVAPVAGQADANTPPGVNNVRYAVLLGTSMAAPVAAGNAALLRQYFRTRHGQMRRPLLLEGVPLPVAAPGAPLPPQPVFASRPALVPHVDGLVAAWVTPALAGSPRHIVARRIARHPTLAGAAVLDANPLELAAGVGEHAALALATAGDLTYLLYRHADGKMRLAAFTRALTPLPGFGAAGVVTLTPDARPDDAAPPALVTATVGGVVQLACAWPTTASANTGGFFQRFRGDTGAAIDASAVSLLFHQATGPQQPLQWTGNRFAWCGVTHGARWQLQLRLADVMAAPQGTGPVTVVEQDTELRDPCLLWDASAGRYLLAWCDARRNPGGEVWRLFLDEAGQPQGSAEAVFALAAPVRARRPQLARHPDGGYLLAWEDDSQDTHFDVYLMLLGPDGLPDGRLPAEPGAGNRPLVRLSDSPGDTDGYALAVDDAGVAVAWQNPDEVNGDRIGCVLAALTRTLAFEATRNPATPWLRSGRWEPQELLSHAEVTLTPVSAVWTGATWDLLRLGPGGGAGSDRRQWLRLNSDGAPDPRHGNASGLRERAAFGLTTGLELLWTGNDRRITAVIDGLTGLAVHLDDDTGAPVPAFGTGGLAALADALPFDNSITPQPGFFTRPAFTVLVAYGALDAGALKLRLQRLDRRGRREAGPVTLADAGGVARHGWFMFVNGEAQAIAVWHRTTGAVTRVFGRRFDTGGQATGTEQAISAALGEGSHASLARRPVAVDSPRREYLVAWQYRSAPAAPWEIHVARLDRRGVPMANPPGVPVATLPLPVADVPVITPATPGWSATRQALAPQLVCTHVHAPWTLAAPLPAGVKPPDWSPSFGLAWLGEEADGTRRLYFTVLDENGRRLNVPQPPPYPAPPVGAANRLSQPQPAAIVPLGTPGATVQEFRLAWNGRVFLLTWTETLAGTLRHRATLLNRHGSDSAWALPSAALLRTALVGSATNLAATVNPAPVASLPHLASGQGWGRINLRQALAPALPVTFEVRDDVAIGPGRSLRWRFNLPAGTALLRVTLGWTDPPGARLVNPLHLTVRLGGQEFRGNLWDAAAGRTHLSRPVASPPARADAHEDIHPYKQVVVANPAAGDVEVEVAAGVFPADPFNQQDLQPFALVFCGTGPEVVFNQNAAGIAGTPVY